MSLLNDIPDWVWKTCKGVLILLILAAAILLGSACEPTKWPIGGKFYG